MSWPKPEHIRIDKPIKPELWRWVLLSIFTFIIVTLSFILISNISPDIKSALFWFISLFGIIIVTGLITGIRFYFYGSSLENYNVWIRERENVDNRWREWGMKNLIVLGSCTVTPNNLFTKKILLDSANIPVILNKCLSFENEEVDFKFYFEEIFLSFRRRMLTMPKNLFMEVNILSSDSSFDYLDYDFNDAYQRMELPFKYQLHHNVITENSVDLLSEYIDSPNENIKLVIINNIKSQEDRSAFIVAFLLIGSKQAEALGFSTPLAHLYRPMTGDDVAYDMKQMVEMQPAIQTAQHLWLGNADPLQRADVGKQLADYDIAQGGLKTYPGTYDIDAIAGKTGYLSYWLTLAFACEAATITADTHLVFAAHGQQGSFTTVANENLSAMG